MKQITIIGAGEIGSALAQLLGKSNDVSLWDKNSSKVAKQKPLEETLPKSDLVFLCVPSWAIRQVLTSIQPLLTPNNHLVSLAKGMESTGHTMDSVLEDFVAPNRYCLLAGPMLAEELKKDEVSVGIVASYNRNIFYQVEDAFADSKLKLEFTHDVMGTAASSVLKNIFAVGLGITDCLEWGSNIKGWLVTKIMDEMVVVADLLGGHHVTVLGTAGMGDLIATGFSEYSLNHQVGEELVKFGKCSLVSEGLVSIQPLWQKVRGHKKHLPLLSLLQDVIINKKKPEPLLVKFIQKYV